MKLRNSLVCLGGLLLVVILSGLTERVSAQAETLPKNRSVFSAFYTRSDTDKRFDFFGNRVRVIPPGGPQFTGFTKTDIVSFDYAYGITDRLEAHFTVPYAHSEVATVGADGKTIKDPTASPVDSAISNVRFGFRYNLVREPLYVTAKFDVKLPANSGSLQKAFAGATLPVDEGQTDFDITGQVSKSFIVKDRTLRIGGEAGIRIRRTQKDGGVDAFTNEVLPIKPGNEFIYNFQVNYGINRFLSLTLAGNGIEGRSFDVPFRTIRVGNDGEVKTVGTKGKLPPGFKPDFDKQSGRKIFSLGPLANISITPRTIVTGGVLFAARGQNYPAGYFLVLGVSRIF
ncbi:MAG: hypothetical protein K1Y36_23645 [Blastocatellia bacterium]|nr:hypothetical protein [Blastocatellia bacterium]